MPRNKRTKTQADLRLEQFRAVQSRPVNSGTFRELSGVVTTKRGIKEAISSDDFLREAARAWQPVAIETAGKKWQK